ncbi:MAG: endolytic transglycosylase MltG [Oscillospiraceae bacterium]|nr:endolytic transglycosylase MltG [Oscillospiraceae bacterium]
MDENQFKDELNLSESEGSYDLDEFEKSENSVSKEEIEKTQEISSIMEHSGADRAIRSREEFTELNSPDDLQRTRLMNSVSDNSVQHIPAENTVKRRKKRKKKTQVNHTRTMGQVFLGVLISVISLAAGVILAVYSINGLRDFTGMAKTVREAEITIDSSMPSDEIVDELYKNGIINMPYLMKSYLRLVGNDEKPFLTGSYTLYSNMSYGSLIDTLKTPKQYTEIVRVTIPEGATAKEIGELLEKNYVCRAVDFENYYKNKLNKYDFEEGIKDDPNRFNMLEGYLFPDSYDFYVIDDLKKNPNFDTSRYAEIAANKMYDNFESKITKAMKQRMEELGMTLDEVIRLASLICWEANSEETRKGVSSVFHNRLNNSEEFPLLQSDTTYTYIDEVITPSITASNKDKMQAIIDAYNTYLCEGLPAGAICNPGLAEIMAALEPANTNYYYFLASKDGNFYWARTLEEHEQNIKDAALREENG